ncbi:MAG: hypothetical protein K2X29_09355 [Candidatus Obscuribacterales bacterium]|nr:hypothetical protein [Candidatus Obscuribacterales bacterium]
MKSIFVILLTLLFCFGVNLRECICLEQPASIQAQAEVSNHIQNVCKDCGHESNCCFSHTKLPLAGSLSLSHPTSAMPVQSALSSFEISHPSNCSEILANSGTNKAPPWSRTQTPILLHQKLLI